MAVSKHRSEPDYIDRTIATVRNHREADNCWPQWANIFADEIEDLRSDVAFHSGEAARLREERDAALVRVADRHDDVRRASERAEAAYRARDAAEARCARLEQEAVPYELVLLLETAELEVQRLREERDTLTERDYWNSQTIREQEAELVRLREMLARVRPDIDPETGYGRVEAI